MMKKNYKSYPENLMKKYKYQFTVFTPVYNRKHTIHRVWNSLNAQTYRDFEWIIVDDGSTDNVLPLLKEYKTQANFPVTILTQENSGKHFAWNRAVKIARGELFVPADSDDVFIHETLKKFIYYWESIPENQRDKYSGINVLCKDSETGEIVGNKFPESPFISNNLDLYYKYKIEGEKWGCIKTDILKCFMFPEKFKRTYFPESFLWHSIARKYQNVSVNESLRIYYQDSGNQISANSRKNMLKDAFGKYYYLSWNLNANLDYKLKYENPISLIKSYLNLWRLGLLSDNSVFGIINKMRGISKLLTIITAMPGLIVYWLTYSKIKKSGS